MPGTTLNIDLPTGDDLFVTWRAKVAAALEAILADIEPKIDAGALDITSPLSLGGAPLLNASRVQLVSSAATDVGSLYTDVNGDLHIITQAGDVTLTADGAIAISALGTIGGDYGGSNPATVAFIDSTKNYEFKSDTDVWAGVSSGWLKLNGENGTVTVSVHDDLTGNKAFKFRSLPGSGVGGLAYDAASGSMVDAAAARETSTHLFTAIDASGAVTSGAVVTGTDLKFTTNRTRVVPAASAEQISAGYAGTGVFQGSWWRSSASDDLGIVYPVPLDAGDTLVSLVVKGTKGSNASSSMTATLWRAAIDDANGASVVNMGSFTNSANAPGNINLPISSINHTLQFGYQYFVIATTKANTNDYLGCMPIVWKR